MFFDSWFGIIRILIGRRSRLRRAGNFAARFGQAHFVEMERLRFCRDHRARLDSGDRYNVERHCFSRRNFAFLCSLRCNSLSHGFRSDSILSKTSSKPSRLYCSTKANFCLRRCAASALPNRKSARRFARKVWQQSKKSKPSCWKRTARSASSKNQSAVPARLSKMSNNFARVSIEANGKPSNTSSSLLNSPVIKI